MRIQGTGNPVFYAEVDSKGRVQARSASLSEQEQAALDGESFNINIGTTTLTNATSTGILYLKNNGIEDLNVKRVFFNFAASTGGSGELYAQIIANPTGGTLISSGTSFSPANFNTGSNKVLTVDLKKGTTGNTVTGGSVLADFLLPTASNRYTVPFESIVIPQGASIAITLQAPAGNSSLKFQAGINAYKEDQG